MNFEELANSIKSFLREKKAFTLLETAKICQETQSFLIQQIEYLDVKTAICFEKTAKLINNINDIADYYSTDYLEIEEYNYIFQDNIAEKIFNNPLDNIFDIDKVEGPYTVDSSNTIIDFDFGKTFTQHIHATKNVDTDYGQDKLIFNIDNSHRHKNVYIIDSIVKKNHKGLLFKNNENKHLFNLLPFMAMINKITTQKSIKTMNENLHYFFKTPVIIIGDISWIDYCRQMMAIYSKDMPDERKWIFSDYYIQNDKSDVQKNIIEYLKIYTIQLIDSINTEGLKKGIGLQKNESIILKQLYRLIKSVIFFMEKEGVCTIEYKSQVDTIIKCIESIDSDYECLNLKNIEYQSYKLCSNIIVSHGGILNEVLSIKKIYSTLQNYNAEINIFKFIIDIHKSLGFSKKSRDLLVSSHNKEIEKFLTINKNYFISLLSEDFFKDIPKSLNLFEKLIFMDFPSFGDDKFFIKNKEDKEKMYILFFLYIIKSDDNLLIRVKEYARRDFYNVPIDDRKFWKISLLSKMLQSNHDFNFGKKTTLEMRKVIAIYKTNCLINLNPDLYQDLKIEANNIKKHFHLLNAISKMSNFSKDDHSLSSFDNNSNTYKMRNEDPIKFFNFSINNDKYFYSTVVDFFDFIKVLPADYAFDLSSKLNPEFIIDLIDHLDYQHKHLRDSLIWFVSHSYEGITYNNKVAY